MSSGDAGARTLCHHCGAVCEPYQEYCLNCGTRLFDNKTIVGDIGEYWRQALSPSHGHWARPVLVALVVAIIASMIAIAATRGDPTRTIEALGPNVSSQAAGTGTETSAAATITNPAATTGAAGGTGAISTREKPPFSSRGLIAWPGQPAWTIVLASVPTSSGKTGARSKALEARDAGLGDVGVLKSSDYSSLHPGYYVVFSGIYKSESTAQKRLPAARRAGFDSPYVKRVAS